MTIHKTFEIKVLDKRENGGRIRINTASVDRDNDRVFPVGARIDSYMKNPTVQWGHNYTDPWAVAGKTNELVVTPEYIDADFDLRPAANDADPQNIVLLLWNGEWVRTASIGFMPNNKEAQRNEIGGVDYNDWELLEWSLVPIPSQRDAMRLAVKAFEDEVSSETGETDGEFEPLPDFDPTIKRINEPFTKRGRVLSARNEKRIRDAATALTDVLSELGEAEPADEESRAIETPTDPPIDDPSHDAREVEEKVADALSLYIEQLSRRVNYDYAP